MFHQGSGPGLRALTLVILSLALIVFDQRSTTFHAFHTQFASRIAYPFQRMVDAPVGFVQWLNASVKSQSSLLDENAQLRAEQILLQARLQRLLALQKENTQLRQLLQSTPQISGRVAVARLLAVALDPNLEEVVLDKGSQDDVYHGQPVLDGFGVMGQVIGVGPVTSKILLITDKQSAVPVEDYRNGIRAIAVGLGVSGQLALMNVPAQSDIQPGDLFVTSGLGMCYPVGYPVGVVSHIEQAKNELTKKIILAPKAHLDQTEQVLLAWPSKKELRQAVQAQLNSDATIVPSIASSVPTTVAATPAVTNTTNTIKVAQPQKPEKTDTITKKTQELVKKT